MLAEADKAHGQTQEDQSSAEIKVSVGCGQEEKGFCTSATAAK